MSTRKKTSPKVAPVAAPPPQPPRQRDPAWAARRLYGPQHSSRSIHQVVEAIRDGYYHLPRFQRPYVWTDAQVLRLLDSIEQGYSIGPVIEWEQGTPPAPETTIAGLTFASKTPWTALLVDGQQRIGAIAKAFLSGRFAYDCAARRFVVDESPRVDLFPLTLLWSEHYCEAMNLVESWPSGLDKMAYLDTVLTWREVSHVILPRQWTLTQVVESYRRLNTEGTPMHPDDLAAGLARVTEVKP